MLKNRNLINRINCSNLFTNNIKKFSLYIPRKELTFINHPKHGRVYPVYIADEDFNKKNSPAKLTPLILLFSGFNLYLLLSGLQILPMTSLYQIVYTNEIFFYSSIAGNYYLLRKYFKYLGNYSNRIKSMYLFPSGSEIILETFDAEVKKLENLDIYDFNIRNKLDDIKNKKIKWNPLLITNDNNLQVIIKWGRAKENNFEGKSKIMDFEIFSQIIARNNIDTNITQFKKELPIGYYTKEEKQKIGNYLRKKEFTIKRIDRFRLNYWYKILRDKYIGKKEKKVISEEHKFY